MRPVVRERNFRMSDAESDGRHSAVPAAPARALGALALGAVALGAVAIGALAIGALAIGRARIRRLEIDELIVRKLRVIDALETPGKPRSDGEG
jgi:hypothetical protein